MVQYNVNLEGKTVLVTGAAGFIGSNLVKRLFKDIKNIKVIGIDSITDYYDVNIKYERLKEIEALNRDWEFVHASISDKVAVEKIFTDNKIAVVVNLAAQAGVRYSITNPDAYIESNLIGFYNLLEACRHHEVEHLVYASSSSVYGSNKKVPYSTDDKVDNPVSLYAATKKSNELMAHAYSKLYNIPSTGLRFFTVYGPAGRPDMAYFGFTNKLRDGKTIQIMSSAQDHKRAKDGDQGLNTGGMGNFSPSPFYTKEVDAFCKKYIYQATVDAMSAEGRTFQGVIFFGLMLTPDGPKVLEYNVRFGDPEAQVVLPRMKNDILDVCEACIDGTLDQLKLEFEDNATVCVVLASDGYPLKYDKGLPISGLEAFDGKDDVFCFHAGTRFAEDGKTILTNGGRVLGITAKAPTLKEARAKAYAATEWVNFANKYMRHDIGKAIDEA